MNISKRLLRLAAGFAVMGASSQLFAAKLGFKGECRLTDMNGKSLAVGHFNLDHAESMAGNCPHTTLEFRAPSPGGAGVIEQQVYVEYQRGYAGIYIGDGVEQSSHNSIDRLFVGNRMHAGLRLSKDAYLSCEGKLQ